MQSPCVSGGDSTEFTFLYSTATSNKICLPTVNLIGGGQVLLKILTSTAFIWQYSDHLALGLCMLDTPNCKLCLYLRAGKTDHLLDLCMSCETKACTYSHTELTICLSSLVCDDIKHDGDDGFFTCGQRHSLIHLFANKKVWSGDETIIVET